MKTVLKAMGLGAALFLVGCKPPTPLVLPALQKPPPANSGPVVGTTHLIGTWCARKQVLLLDGVDAETATLTSRFAAHGEAEVARLREWAQRSEVPLVVYSRPVGLVTHGDASASIRGIVDPCDMPPEDNPVCGAQAGDGPPKGDDNPAGRQRPSTEVSCVLPDMSTPRLEPRGCEHRRLGWVAVCSASALHRVARPASELGNGGE